MRHHSMQSKQLYTWTDTNSSMTIIQCTFTCTFIYTYAGKHAHSVSVSMQTCVHILRKVCTISNFCADVYIYVHATVPYSRKYAHSVSLFTENTCRHYAAYFVDSLLVSTKYIVMPTYVDVYHCCCLHTSVGTSIVRKLLASTSMHSSVPDCQGDT